MSNKITQNVVIYRGFQRVKKGAKTPIFCKSRVQNHIGKKCKM